MSDDTAPPGPHGGWGISVPELQAHLNGHGQAGIEAARDEAYLEWRAQESNRKQLRDLPPPAPLIHGNILYGGTTAWLTGAPGTFKSFIALDWALCIASGRPWLDRRVEPGPVLYIAGEGLSGLNRRIDAWQDARRAPDEDLRSIAFRGQTSLLHGETQQFLLRSVAETPHSLIVVDTQARATPGANENDKHELDSFIGILTEIASGHGCTTLVVHHDTKAGGRLRGSGAIEGAADTVHIITKDEDDRYEISMKIHKHKDSESGEELALSMLEKAESLVVSNGNGEREALGPRIDPEAFKRLCARILALADAAGGGMARSEIRSDLGEKHAASNSIFHRAVNDLLLQGLLVESGSRVAVSAAGKGRLAWYREHGLGH